MSQKNAEALVPTSNMALISICNPGVQRNLKDGWGARLDVVFNDITYSPPKEYDGQYVLFDADIAKEIVSFINTLPPIIDHIVIHCLAGLSRSPAIAKVLCEKYGEKFPEDHPYIINALVYELFKEEMNNGKDNSV